MSYTMRTTCKSHTTTNKKKYYRLGERKRSRKRDSHQCANVTSISIIQSFNQPIDVHNHRSRIRNHYNINNYRKTITHFVSLTQSLSTNFSLTFSLARPNHHNHFPFLEQQIIIYTYNHLVSHGQMYIWYRNRRKRRFFIWNYHADSVSTNVINIIFFYYDLIAIFWQEYIMS